MKAVLPVAGLGSRLRPHTHTTPKALLQVAGRPILGHIIETLLPIGVDHLVLVVGFLGEKIVEYVRRTYPCEVTVVEQPERKGLGHAIWLTREAVRDDEPLLIVLGDTIFEADLHAVATAGQNALGLMPVADPTHYGIAELAGSRVVRLVEKPARPPSNQAIVGVYFLRTAGPLFAALEQVIARDIKVRGEYQLTDALQWMIDHEESLSAFQVTGWFDCGSPDNLLAANRRLLEKLPPESVRLPDCVIVPPVYIAPTARLSQCVVGPYVSVGDGAELCRAVVKNAIIGEAAQVRDALLCDSIIGERAGVTGNYARLNVGESCDIRVVS